MCRLTFPCKRLTPLTAPLPRMRQIRHIERLRRVVRILAAESQQVMERNAELLLGIATEVLLDEGRSETVKAGGHRGMRGKQVACPGNGQRDFEGLPGLFHEGAGAFQHGESRMPFIQVTDLRLNPQRAEQPPSADPEQQFLLEAEFRAAAVELAGDPSMRGDVRRVIAVQQVELHSADLDLPGAQPDRVSGQRDLQPQPLPIRLAQRRDRQLSGIVIRKEGLLRSVFIDHLAKIALLVEQSHADHRHTQIAGGFELIAGHVSKAARVDGQSFAQHEFHAEIGRAGQGSVRMILLKPGGRTRRLPAGFHQAVHIFPKNGVGQYALNLVPRDRLQDDPGILRDLPQFGIKLAPHFVGRMIPRPAHVQRKLRQGIEALDFGGQKVVDRVADAGSFTHDLPLRSGVAAKVASTMACASSRMRRR